MDRLATEILNEAAALVKRLVSELSEEEVEVLDDFIGGWITFDTAVGLLEEQVLHKDVDNES
jgi:hypothetical protein